MSSSGRPSLGGGLSYALRYTRALFLGLGCKLFLGEFPRPGVVLRNGLEHEAERLSALLQAGCRVPEVWWRSAACWCWSMWAKIWLT